MPARHHHMFSMRAAVRCYATTRREKKNDMRGVCTRHMLPYFAARYDGAVQAMFAAASGESRSGAVRRPDTHYIHAYTRYTCSPSSAGLTNSDAVTPAAAHV